MENITYNWEEVESSKADLDALINDSAYLKEYLPPFAESRGEVATSVMCTGTWVKNIKTQMDRMANKFSSFLTAAQVTYETVEDQMKSDMGVEN